MFHFANLTDYTLANLSSKDEIEEEQQDRNTKATNSIFFPQPGEFQSVLLKRGPVLSSSDEEERELMVFTNGFVLSRVELDSFVNKLFDDGDDMSVDQLSERFSQIDVDHSGCKYNNMSTCKMNFDLHIFISLYLT